MSTALQKFLPWYINLVKQSVIHCSTYYHHHTVPASRLTAALSQNWTQSAHLLAKSLLRDSVSPMASSGKDLSSRKALQYLCHSSTVFLLFYCWPSQLEYALTNVSRRCRTMSSRLFVVGNDNTCIMRRWSWVSVRVSASQDSDGLQESPCIFLLWCTFNIRKYMYALI